MKKLKIIGWIYMACGAISLISIGFYTFFNKIEFPHTLVFGIGCSSIFITALMERKDRPKNFVSLLFLSLALLMAFILSLAFDLTMKQ